MNDKIRDPAKDGVIWAQTSKEEAVVTAEPEAGADYDVVVVGGGFCGLATTLQVARSGMSVALFEAGVIGAGASGRTGGLVVPHFPGGISLSSVQAHLGAKKANALGDLVCNGPGRVFDLVREHQIKCDAEQRGWIQPAHSRKSLPKVRKVFEDWKAFGAEVEWLDRDAVTASLGTACHVGGWRNQTGGIFNPLALCRGLARAAVDRGAAVFQNTPVVGLKRDQSGVTVTLKDKTLRTRKALIATNGYTGSGWGKLSRTVIPIRLWHTFTRPLPADLQEQILPGRICFTDIRRSGGFCRYDVDNRIFSGGAVFGLGDPRKAGIAHSKERLQMYFPQLPEPEIECYWEGYCALTTAMLPSLQVIDKDIFAIVGFSTRGVSLAQNIGWAAGDLLAEKTSLDDFPLEVGAPEPIPWQGLKTFLGQYAFPVYKAMDRWGFS